MQNLAFDVAHLLAGSMLVLSFVLLYQDRITAVLNVFALQAIALPAITLLISGCGSTAPPPATPKATAGSANASATSGEATPKQPDSSQATESASTNASQPNASSNLRVVRLSDAELNEGWILLFDEQTMFGWEPGSKAN